MQDPPHGPPNKPSSATSFENFSFRTIGKPPSLLARFSTEIVSPAQSSGLSPSPAPRTDSMVLPPTSNSSATSPLTSSRNALHGAAAAAPLTSTPVRSAASVSSTKPTVGDLLPPITAPSSQRPAVVESRPQADVDGSHGGTVQAQSSARQPQLAPLATVDFYKRISDLAKERAEWEELSTLHQRYREEHEEYTRRHEETIRAAQREKDQVDRVVAAADMALSIIDKLRIKQEQRLTQEQRFTDDALAASLVKPPTQVEVSPEPVTVNVTTLSNNPSAPSPLAYSAPVSTVSESSLAGRSSTAEELRRSEEPLSPTVSSDVTSHPPSYDPNPSIPLPGLDDNEKKREEEFQAKKAAVMADKQRARVEQAARILAQRDMANVQPVAPSSVPRISPAPTILSASCATVPSAGSITTAPQVTPPDDPMPRPIQELVVDVSLAPTSVTNGTSSRATAQAPTLPPNPLPAKPLPAKLKRKGEALSTVTIPPSAVPFVHREQEQGYPSPDSARLLPELPASKDTMHHDEPSQQKPPNHAPLMNNDPIVKRERSPSLGLEPSSFANAHEHSDGNGRMTGVKFQDSTEEMQLAWPSPSPSPPDYNSISSHRDPPSRPAQAHPTQHHYTPQHPINQHYPSRAQDLPPLHATDVPYQAGATTVSALDRKDINQSRAPEPELDATHETYTSPSVSRSTRQDPTPPFSRKRPRSDDRHWEPSDTPSSFRRKVSEAGDRSYQPPPHTNRGDLTPPHFPRIMDYRDPGPRGYDSYRPSSPEQSSYVDTVQQRVLNRNASGRRISIRPITHSDANDATEAGTSRRVPEIPLERRIQDPLQVRQPANTVASTSRQDVSTNRRGRPKSSPDRRTRPNRRNGPRLSDRAFSPDNTSQSLASRINPKSLENRIA